MGTKLIRKLTEGTRFAWWGLLGAGCLLVALSVPRIGFRNHEGGSFSIFNHFISELGWYEFSPLAIVFGIGLFLGGLAFSLFVYGLSRHYDGFLARANCWLGVTAALGCSLVGVFPVDLLPLHLLAASPFFSATLGRLPPGP